MIAIALATLALVGLDASAGPMAVAVVAPKEVTDSLVHIICDEAESIWEPAGVRLECGRKVPESSEPPPAIEVTIDDGREPSGPDGALGWLTFTNGHPDDVIHLSHAWAEDLLRKTAGLNDATIAAHESYLGRALGRALAHELGHYLLRSTSHTRHGLMRAEWVPDETFARSRAGFALTVPEREAVAGSRRMGSPLSRYSAGETPGIPVETKSISPFKSLTVQSGRTPSCSAG